MSIVERYGLEFVGKRAALDLLHAPVKARLVPDRAGSIAFDRARDVFIEGDNLEALKLLQRPYFGRVDMIYIDPPYNTGNDFVFRDAYAESVERYRLRAGDEDGGRLVSNPERSGRYHSAWLAMMLPRLCLARDLLRDEGLIFISIDDHEVHNLRLVLNEVFGEENFISQVTLISNRGGRDYMKIAVTHEYLLCYGKTPQARVRELPKGGPPPKYADSRGPYELRELRNRNPRFHPGNRPNLFYPVHVDSECLDGHRCAPVSLEPSDRYPVVVEPRNRVGAGSVWRWGRERLVRNLVEHDPEASEVVARQRSDGGWNVYEKHRKSTTKARSVWDDKAMRSERGTKAVRELFGAAVFDHPKPVELLKRCMQLGLDSDGIVLDFFAGSATVAQAALELNREDSGTRRVIAIQLGEATPEGSDARKAGYDTIAELARDRIRRVGERDGEAELRSFRVVPATTRTWSASSGLDAAELLELMADALEPDDVAAEEALWSHLITAGVALDARVEGIAGHERLWRVFDPDQGRTIVICLEDRLEREIIDRLDLAEGSHIVCRDSALDDSLALNLARRYHLETVP